MLLQLVVVQIPDGTNGNLLDQVLLCWANIYRKISQGLGLQGLQ